MHAFFVFIFSFRVSAMRQYQVPQFITIEDKVIGPFTAKQFFFLGGGALLIVAARLFLAPFLSFPIGAFIAIFALALAFLKINDQSFPLVVKNASLFAFRPRLYVWKHELSKQPRQKGEVGSTPETAVQVTPQLSRSRLSDLAWSLNIKEHIREEEQQQAGQKDAGLQ